MPDPTLLGIPPELRNRIYALLGDREYCDCRCHVGKPVECSTCSARWRCRHGRLCRMRLKIRERPHIPPMAQVCQQVRMECLPMFIHDLEIDLGTIDLQPEEGRAYYHLNDKGMNLEVLGPELLQYVRSVEFDAHTYSQYVWDWEMDAELFEGEVHRYHVSLDFYKRTAEVEEPEWYMRPQPARYVPNREAQAVVQGAMRDLFLKRGNDVTLLGALFWIFNALAALDDLGPVLPRWYTLTGQSEDDWA